MHLKSNNTEFKTFDNLNDVAAELLFFFFQFALRNQNNLEKSLRWSDFIFDLIQLLYYKCLKTNLRRTGSNIILQVG